MRNISIKKWLVCRLGEFSGSTSFYLINALIFVLLCHANAYAGTQFFEDFKGKAVDKSRWAYPTGEASFNGRTQMRAAYPSVSNGLLHLQLDTYNPTAKPAGTSFYGSEIFLRKNFERGTGLIIEIRARLVKPVKGLVGGAFLYNYFPETQNHSEIDFELLSNSPDQVQTNIYANEPLGIGHPEFNGIPKFDITRFNIYRIEWLPDRVRWLVNNQLVRENKTFVPHEELALYLNFYAPECNWAIACDANLQPAASPADNKKYFFDIDWVRATVNAPPHNKQKSSNPKKQ